MWSRLQHDLSGRLARRLLPAASGPEWLILGVNNVCNMKCRMCDVGLGDPTTAFWANLIGEKPQNMSLELLHRILDQAEALAPRPRVALAFTEPLIHPRVVEMCRAITARGFLAAITTNGLPLERQAEGLVESGLHELNVSIDGPAAVHDRIRGVPGGFARISRGLAQLRAVKERTGTRDPRVTLSFTIVEENQRSIVEFLAAVEPLGASAINVSQLNFITDGMAEAHGRVVGGTFEGGLRVVRSNLGSMDPARFDAAALSEELARARAFAASRPGFPPLSIVPAATDVDTLERFYRRPLEPVGGTRCTDPWHLVMVKTDGTVIPAHGRCFNLPLGNVRESTLQEIWYGGRLAAFRRTLTEHGGSLPACQRCCGLIGKPAGA